MRVLDRLLLKLHAKGHRVVLFSQFSSMVDLLDDYCTSRTLTLTVTQTQTLP